MPWPHADDIEPGDVINILGIDHVFYETTLRVGGTPSWNNNNPGNIAHLDGEAESYGAYPGKHNDIFAIFPTEDIGFEAVKRFLRRREHKTIIEMMRLHAQAGQGPNGPETYAMHITARLNVPTDTAVSSLDDDQLAAFARWIQHIEGWREGRIHRPDDLPEHVDHWLLSFPTRIEREAADQPRATRGAASEGAKNIQRRLNEWGSTPRLVLDGIFGSDTEAAVRWFQQANGLSTDGIVGNRTWRNLMGV